MIDEKVWMFNPFNLKDVTNEAISEQINEIAKRYVRDANTLMDISMNIDLGTSLLDLYSELHRRYKFSYLKQKYDTDVKFAKDVYERRKEWSRTKTEKAPAITYFEAEAKEKFQLARDKEYELQTWAERLKEQYELTVEKVNAWKKRQEAVKYEIGL